MTKALGYQVLVDNTSTSGAEYIGCAASGTATSAPHWQIRKVTLDSDGKPTSIKCAESTDTFSNVWDDRTTYTYA